ncbi:MAG: hypothetical protein HOV68_32625 [Streptomycetaceae bacterium]|nr:hypothetical protein [Streptomycetaceae bacterium]
MTGLVTFLVILVALGIVMGTLGRLALSARRRGTAGSAMRAALMAYDEGIHGTAHDSHIEIQVQARRKVPVMSPDDPLRWNDGVPLTGRPGRPARTGRDRGRRWFRRGRA